MCTLFYSHRVDPSCPARDLVAMRSRNIPKHGSAQYYGRFALCVTFLFRHRSVNGPSPVRHCSISVPTPFHLRSVTIPSPLRHRSISVPSPFHFRSVRMVCVHTVHRIQSPSTSHDRPVIISIRYTAHCHGMYFTVICSPS